MLKTILIPMLLISTLTSCDAPRNRSSLYGYPNHNTTAGEAISTSAGSFLSPSRSIPDQTEKNYNDPNKQNNTIPSAYRHCLSPENPFPNRSSYLNNYFICQDQTNRDKIYFWPQTSRATKICLIPMYSNGNQSLNIGDAQCQYPPTSGGMEFTLQRNRPGFENYVTNGVMIMRDEAFVYPYPYTLKTNGPIANTTAFFICMQTAHQTAAYCSAFAQMKQYQLHLFHN